MKGAAPSLNRPPWLAAAGLAALVAGTIAWAVWPGYMSYDSLLAWDQARYGVQTALWPPLHTYLFQLSLAAGAGAGGLLAVQLFLLVFGAVLAIRMLVPRRALGWTLALLFLAGLAYFPPLLGSMLAHWRDVPTAAFALMGLALWLAAAERRSPVLLVAAILSFGVSLGLRYNALVLVAPALALMVWRPYLGAPARGWTRALVVAVVALSLGLAWASTQWRLPDGVKLPNPGGLGGAQLFDLIGVSACSGRNHLPPAVSGGQPVTIAQLRRAYDPRHLQMTLAPRPGVPRLVETDAAGAVPQVWREVLVTEAPCYIAHRSAVFVEQMGMARTGVFYPVHGGVDPNPHGLALARPQTALKLNAYIRAHADEWARRPFLLYAAAAGLGLLAARRDRRLGLLILALLAGAFAYPALLFVAAPAADARYIFPSNVLSLLIALASLGVLAGPGHRGRRHG